MTVHASICVNCSREADGKNAVLWYSKTYGVVGKHVTSKISASRQACVRIDIEIATGYSAIILYNIA